MLQMALSSFASGCQWWRICHFMAKRSNSCTNMFKQHIAV